MSCSWARYEIHDRRRAAADGSAAKNLLKLTMRRGFVPLGAADLKATLTPAELKYLAEQEVISINCTYLGESLAVMGCSAITTRRSALTMWPRLRRCRRCLHWRCAGGEGE